MLFYAHLRSRPSSLIPAKTVDGGVRASPPCHVSVLCVNQNQEYEWLSNCEGSSFQFILLLQLSTRTEYQQKTGNKV